MDYVSKSFKLLKKKERERGGSSLETEVDLLGGPSSETFTPSTGNGPQGNSRCFHLQSI